MFSWTCHSKKSESRETPLVRISISTGGQGMVEMSGSRVEVEFEVGVEGGWF